ncbi:MAG: hypothetical protein AAGF88_01575 [Pseudomonadota bacterium]
MDYGIRLFRHVVNQVFGNLSQALRISLVPAILFGIAFYWATDGFAVMGLFASQFADPAQPVPSEEEFAAMAGFAGRAFVLVILGAVLFSWVAVAWHRYVLTEELSPWLPPFSAGRTLGYLGRTILIGLALFAALIPISLLFGGLLATGNFAVGLFFGIAVNMLMSWLFVRWALILPARAIDRKLTFRESWDATSEVSGEILVPIIGFAVIFTMITQVLILLPSNPVFALLLAAVYWIQTLMNLALLTTLYGNRIEGRELN